MGKTKRHFRRTTPKGTRHLEHGTNPDNMALFKITVLCALLQAAAALKCSGDRNFDNQTSVVDSPSGMKTVKVGSTPYGTYSASDIPGTEVTYIDVVFPERTVTDPALFNADQTYTLSVSGCRIKIHWCPDQNYFV